MKRWQFPRTAFIVCVSLAVYFFYYVTLRSSFLKTASPNDVFLIETVESSEKAHPSHGREAFEAKEEVVEDYDNVESTTVVASDDSPRLPEPEDPSLTANGTLLPNVAASGLRFDFPPGDVKSLNFVNSQALNAEQTPRTSSVDPEGLRQFGEALVDIERDLLRSVEKLGDRWNLTKQVSENRSCISYEILTSSMGIAIDYRCADKTKVGELRGAIRKVLTLLFRKPRCSPTKKRTVKPGDAFNNDAF
jgi:hypothetical protein